MNCYAVLGIPRNADEERIGSAYRSLVQRYHPYVHSYWFSSQHGAMFNELIHSLDDDFFSDPFFHW